MIFMGDPMSWIKIYVKYETFVWKILIPCCISMPPSVINWWHIIQLCKERNIWRKIHEGKFINKQLIFVIAFITIKNVRMVFVCAMSLEVRKIYLANNNLDVYAKHFHKLRLLRIRVSSMFQKESPNRSNSLTCFNAQI